MVKILPSRLKKRARRAPPRSGRLGGRESMPPQRIRCSDPLIPAGGLMARGVRVGDPVRVSVRDVAAAVHLENRRRDPLLQLLDPKPALPLFRDLGLASFVHSTPPYSERIDRLLTIKSPTCERVPGALVGAFSARPPRGRLPGQQNGLTPFFRQRSRSAIQTFCVSKRLPYGMSAINIRSE